jgi:hypothetical protein
VELIFAYQFTWNTSNSNGTKGKVSLAAAPVKIGTSLAAAISSPSNPTHNQLSGLQGGFDGSEFYHLTAAEYTHLQANVADYAFNTANAAFNAANSKVISVSGTAGQIYSSGGNTPTLNLISTGVSTSVYGGASQIPVINVDSYGRLVSASNVSVQGMDYTYANTIGAASNNWSNTVVAGANAWTNTVFGYANTYSQTVGAASNGWSNTVVAGANSWTNTVFGYSNTYTQTVGAASNAWTNTVFGYSNTYAQTVGAASNGWSNSIGSSSNAWTNTVFGYSNTYTQTVGAASNGWTNTVVAGANAWVNTAVAGANAWSNTKVSSISGTAGQIYSSGGTTPTINLVNTTVTAAIYGGASQIPVINVDSYGRLTSASNISVQGMDYPYANTIGAASNAWVNTVFGFSNTYAQTVGAASNGWTNTVVAGANAWVNTVFGYSNTYSQAIGAASNGWSNTVVAGANAWVNTVFGYSNTYSQAIGAASNGWSNTVVAGANAWVNTVFGYSNTYAQTVGAASNGWSNTVVAGANAWVNTSVAGANAWSNTKVSSVTGTAGQIYSSGGTTPTINLISTTVTSATYGNSTIIPVITVDSYGRLTGVSNVNITTSGGSMDYPYANAIGAASNSWSNTVVAGANAWVNTSVAGANSWSNTKLSNTSGTTFAGNFYVPSGSNLGVGTTSPSANLDVRGSISDAGANVLSQTLTDGATISWDASLGRISKVTLGGNRTIANATNIRVGTYILHVIQDGTGSRTLSWNLMYRFPGNVAPTLTTTANAHDVMTFVSDGTYLYGTYINNV